MGVVAVGHEDGVDTRLIRIEIGDLGAVRSVQVPSGHIRHGGSGCHVGGIDGVRALGQLVLERILVHETVGDVVAQGLEPSLVDIPCAVRGHPVPDVDTSRGCVRGLVVGVVVAGILAVFEVDADRVVQTPETLGPHRLEIETLVEGIRLRGLGIAVGVVAAEMYVASLTSEFEALGSRALENLGIRLDTHRQRFGAGLGIDDDRTGGEVAVLHGRDAADDFHGFDVVGGYLTDVYARIRECSRVRRSGPRHGRGSACHCGSYPLHIGIVGKR